jgi:hypothetical protein
MFDHFNILENERGGFFAWIPGQAGLKSRQGVFNPERTIHYMAEGIDVRLDDTEIKITKYIGNGVTDTEITINGSGSLNLLLATIRGLAGK